MLVIETEFTKEIVSFAEDLKSVTMASINGVKNPTEKFLTALIADKLRRDDRYLVRNAVVNALRKKI